MDQKAYIADQQQRLGSLIDRCRQERGFREKLLADPRGILEQNGIFYPNVTVQAVPMAADEFLFVVPLFEREDFEIPGSNQTDEARSLGEHIQLLLIRCVQERGFREMLLANPREVFERNGVNFPNGITVRAIPMARDTYVLVVPSYQGQIPPS
jgi:hypothetical protein